MVLVYVLGDGLWFAANPVGFEGETPCSHAELFNTEGNVVAWSVQ